MTDHLKHLQGRDVYGRDTAAGEPAESKGERTPPMFRYGKDGELTGELCPDCETEMYLVRLGSRQPMVRCPCGREEKTSELSERIGWSEALRGQPKSGEDWWNR